MWQSFGEGLAGCTQMRRSVKRPKIGSFFKSLIVTLFEAFHTSAHKLFGYFGFHLINLSRTKWVSIWNDGHTCSAHSGINVTRWLRNQRKGSDRGERAEDSPERRGEQVGEKVGWVQMTVGGQGLADPIREHLCHAGLLRPFCQCISPDRWQWVGHYAWDAWAPFWQETTEQDAR